MLWRRFRTQFERTLSNTIIYIMFKLVLKLNDFRKLPKLSEHSPLECLARVASWKPQGFCATAGGHSVRGSRHANGP